MEPTKKLLTDIIQTEKLRPKIFHDSPEIELRKKLQRIDMFRNVESEYKEMLEYKQHDIDKLYATLGLNNQDKKKEEPVDPRLIYNFS